MSELVNALVASVGAAVIACLFVGYFARIIDEL